jgi:hypothetical protein
VEVAQVVRTIKPALRTPCFVSSLQDKSKKSSFLSLTIGILQTVDVHVIELRHCDTCLSEECLEATHCSGSYFHSVTSQVGEMTTCARSRFAKNTLNSMNKCILLINLTHHPSLLQRCRDWEYHPVKTRNGTFQKEANHTWDTRDA